MTAAEDLYREGRAAVLERAQATIDGGATGDPVLRYERRRRRRKFSGHGDGVVPETKLDALRRVAALVLANEVLLDAARENDPDRLDPAAEALEAELGGESSEAALRRFEQGSAALLDRLISEADLVVEHVYPVARTASDVTAFVAVELHLVARMLDPTYEPSDARLLMRTLNGSLRSMFGHGLEDWVAERVKPWRNMVIRRGLAWP